MRWTPLEEWARVAIAAMALVGFATWAWQVPLRSARRWGRFARQFMDDWAGVPESPARPGRPAQPAIPGVMERLQRIDGQMGRNGGSTMADAVHSTALAVDRLHHRLPCLAHEPCAELEPHDPQETED